jgi:hypothetical protein
MPGHDPEAPAGTVAEVQSKPFFWRTNGFKRFFFADVDGLISHGFKTTLQPEDMWVEARGGPWELQSLCGCQ